MSKTKMKSFVKQFVALLSGDDDTVQAQNTFRRAEAGLKTQIHIKEGNLVDFEEALEQAKIKAKEALVNFGMPITDKTNYVSDLVAHQNKVDEAEENLEAEKDLIKFLKEKLEEISKEV